MKRLVAEAITVRRGGRALLDRVSIDIAAGEFVGIVGPNGAGKSTLLRVLAGLLRPGSGEVRLDDAPLDDAPRAVRARRIGYHPQSPELHWPLPVGALVALGRIPHGRGPGALDAADRAVIARTVERTSLGPLLERQADTLSGGELARVHIARLLAGEHELLLADEPIANLDPRYQIEILRLLGEHADGARATVAVLHDLNVAARFCDRLVLLSGGRVAHCGPPAVVLSAATVAEVFGVGPEYHGEAGIAQALAARQVTQPR